MHKNLKTALMIAMGAAILLLPALLASAGPEAMPPRQGGELLKNPGLDGPMWFKSQCCDENGTPINEVQVAEGWTAWWLQTPPDYVEPPDNCEKKAKWGCYWMRPEFVDSARTGAANRIHGGDNSQKYFSFGRMHEAGLYQRVVNVAPGARLRFSIFMEAWMCMEGSACQGGLISDNPATMHMRVGIDPYGGTDPFSSNIVWSGEADSFDRWTQYSVEAVAQGNAVTVFTHSRPEWTAVRLHNDVYVDDASLVKVGEGAVAPTPAGQPGGTQTPGTPASAPCARLRFVDDVTIPDGASVAPGAPFVKTWRVQNTGTCVVSGTLNFIGTGNQMSGQSPTDLPNIEPGQTTDVSIKLTAPTQPGAYQGTWQPRTTDGTALENLFLKITVGEAAATPVVVATATSQATPVTPTAAALATPPQSPLATLQSAPPLPPTATPVMGGLCLSAFEDTNNNNLRDGSEPGLPGVKFAVSSSGNEVAQYVTEGTAQPYCLTTLPPGAYSVQVTLPPGYVTALEQADVALALGQRIDMQVAARRGEKATPTSAATAQPKAPESPRFSTPLIVAILFGVVFLILIGIAVIIIRRGR